MHFASQKSACLHFEHLVLAAFPHHSHIPDLDVRVLAAELGSAVTPGILPTLDKDRVWSLLEPRIPRRVRRCSHDPHRVQESSCVVQGREQVYRDAVCEYRPGELLI